MFRNHSKLFQDPHIQYPIDDLDLSFADYIAKNKKIITDYRVDLQNHNAEKIINANSPYELRPEHPHKIKYGALLVHGLLDSPFIMKDIGVQLQAQGLLVRSVLLPGHGTVPGSLLNVKYEDWLQTVRYGIHSLLKEVDEVFLVGYSTGASLCLYDALVNRSRIAGIIMLAPAVKIYSPFAFITNWYKAIAWAWPRAQWMHVNKEIDYVKYTSMPFNGAYQVYRLTKVLHKIDQNAVMYPPLFMTISYEDRVVSSWATIEYFHTLKNPHDRLIMYSSKHYDSKDPRMTIRSSHFPQYNIRNFSHVCIPIAPDNPHYGKEGDYPLASHIDVNRYLYGSLNRLDATFYDVLDKLKISKYHYRRLTFNPDFEFMIEKMQEFIEFKLLSSEKTQHQ